MAVLLLAWTPLAAGLLRTDLPPADVSSRWLPEAEALRLPSSVPRVRDVQKATAATALAALLFAGGPALADGGTENFKFPPIDRSNTNRCKFVGSAMGQANAARDSLYDLRECKMEGGDAAGFDLSGALLADGDFSKANFKETQFSKVYSPGAKFDGADFSNGILDRGFWKGASFRGAIFNNAVLSGSTFEDADLTDADFTDAYIGQFDQKRLCKNPKLTGENPKTGAPTRESAGCAPAN